MCPLIQRYDAKELFTERLIYPSEHENKSDLRRFLRHWWEFVDANTVYTLILSNDLLYFPEEYCSENNHRKAQFSSFRSFLPSTQLSPSKCYEIADRLC